MFNRRHVYSPARSGCSELMVRNAVIHARDKKFARGNDVGGGPAESLSRNLTLTNVTGTRAATCEPDTGGLFACLRNHTHLSLQTT
jgi:hypothetical protein